MHQITRCAVRTLTTLALAVTLLSAVTTGAQAGLIPYSVIGVHEFDLPVTYQPFNAFLSYNVYRDEGKSWTGSSSQNDTLLTINKFAHFFKIDALPQVGFLWEGLLGAGHVTYKDNNSNSGMIDPQTGVLAWIRPTPTWTTGLEYWLYLPFGSNELSGHSVDHSVAFVTNYTQGNFTLDGDVAVKIRGNYRHDGKHLEQGDTLFANLCLSYKLIKNIEPLVKVDYQTTGPGKDKDTGDRTPSSDELALGVGNHFSLSDKLSADAWYLRGVDGRNTTKTNSVYLKLVYLF